MNWFVDVSFALPLVLAISLVYAATRHEYVAPILGHAGRIALLISSIMGLVLGLLLWFDWLL